MASKPPLTVGYESVVIDGGVVVGWTASVGSWHFEVFVVCVSGGSLFVMFVGIAGGELSTGQLLTGLVIWPLSPVPLIGIRRTIFPRSSTETQSTNLMRQPRYTTSTNHKTHNNMTHTTNHRTNTTTCKIQPNNPTKDVSNNKKVEGHGNRRAHGPGCRLWLRLIRSDTGFEDWYWSQKAPANTSPARKKSTPSSSNLTGRVGTVKIATTSTNNTGLITPATTTTNTTKNHVTIPPSDGDCGK